MKDEEFYFSLHRQTIRLPAEEEHNFAKGT
jgi:hypothetical protein